jgi:hypothetical protein
VFHICTADGAGGLAKYSFLCPNGTIFNQNYFICDWWFNFDCSTAEDLYSLNDEIAAEREAIDAAAAEQGAASDAVPVNSYAAPATEAPADYYDEYVAPEEDPDVPAPVYDEPIYDEAAYDEVPAYDAPIDSYALPTTTVAPIDYYDDATEALSAYGAAEETTLAPALEEYGSPAEEARRGRNSGRRNGRRGGSRGGRQNGRRNNNRRNQRRPSQRAGRRFRG